MSEGNLHANMKLNFQTFKLKKFKLLYRQSRWFGHYRDDKWSKEYITKKGCLHA